jgi:tetratricopeptide (TPR) repeat protein
MHHFRLGMAYAYFAAADYEQAADWARQSIQWQPMPDAYALAAASASYLGQVEAARESLRELRRLRPGIQLADVEQGFAAIGATPELVARLSNGLRIAGADPLVPMSTRE